LVIWVFEKRMNIKEIIMFVAGQAIMLPIAFLLRSIVTKIAEKAIADRRLTTGIYLFFPIEGDQAVRLANGYISGIKIAFWFFTLILPFIFILSLLNRGINL
jgi:hypothetical protein